MQPDIASQPEVREVVAQTDSIVTLAQSYRVTTAEQYSAAGDDLKRVKAAQKKLDEIRGTMVRPINASLAAIRDFFRTPEERLKTAENQIKRALLAYQNEQDRIRREQQRIADEAARKERERLAERAARAAAAGKVEKAMELEQTAAAVVSPVIQREPPKVAGVSTREVWKFEVTDPAAVPREYLAVDESKIRKVVQALKGDTQIAGVRVWPEKALAAGSI